jgi:hypothetical protein
VILECRLPECMKAQTGYYTSTLSFAQDRLGRFTVRLTFIGEGPEWVRVYEYDGRGPARLLKDLPPVQHTESSVEYTDAVEDVSAQSARIYMFRRGEALRKEPGP